MRFRFKSIFTVLVSLLFFSVTDASAQQWQASGSDIYYSNGKVGVGKQTPLSNLHISGGAVDNIIWPIWIENSRNSSTVSGYGVGLKLKHSHNGETTKWGGIASVQENNWANSSGLAFYANETEHVRIKANGNVGIGTKSPASDLHISSGNNGDAVVRIDSDSDNNNESDNSRIEMSQDGGSLGAYIGFNKDWGGNWQPDNVFRIGVRYSNNDKFNALTINTNNANVGIGTANPSNKLTINGTAKAEEIIVEEDTGADFVFEDSYKLTSLSKVEKHINEYKHLPEISSAKEMRKNGVKVGDLQMKLLQKIEELTLYTITQQKILNELRESDKEKKILIEKLQDEIKNLKAENL